MWSSPLQSNANQSLKIWLESDSFYSLVLLESLFGHTVCLCLCELRTCPFELLSSHSLQWRFVVLDAKARIIDIMNATLSLPRTDQKENRPIIEKLEVPVVKRSRFVGLGGLNLKKLMAETGKRAVWLAVHVFSLYAVAGVSCKSQLL